MKNRQAFLNRIFGLLLLLVSGALYGQKVANKTNQNEKIIFHPSHEPKKANAPFSDIVQVDKLFFLSGQIGMDHTTRTLVKGGITTETKQALENIKAVLAQHDLAMENVVKCTVVLADINDFKAFNEIYTAYFSQKPARTTFAASGLAGGAKIEIDCIAAR